MRDFDYKQMLNKLNEAKYLEATEQASMPYKIIDKRPIGDEPGMLSFKELGGILAKYNLALNLACPIKYYEFYTGKIKDLGRMFIIRAYKQLNTKDDIYLIRFDSGHLGFEGSNGAVEFLCDAKKENKSKDSLNEDAVLKAASSDLNRIAATLEKKLVAKGIDCVVITNDKFVARVGDIIVNCHKEDKQKVLDAMHEVESELALKVTKIDELESTDHHYYLLISNILKAGKAKMDSAGRVQVENLEEADKAALEADDIAISNTNKGEELLYESGVPIESYSSVPDFLVTLNTKNGYIRNDIKEILAKYGLDYSGVYGIKYDNGKVYQGTIEDILNIGGKNDVHLVKLDTGNYGIEQDNEVYEILINTKITEATDTVYLGVPVTMNHDSFKKFSSEREMQNHKKSNKGFRYQYYGVPKDAYKAAKKQGLKGKAAFAALQKQGKVVDEKLDK